MRLLPPDDTAEPAPDDSDNQQTQVIAVRTPRQMITGSAQLKALDGTMGAFTSQTHTLLAGSAARQAVSSA